MGVLDPIKNKASEVQEVRDENVERIDLTLENFNIYGSAILNDRTDLMDDPFFFTFWRDEPIMEINTVEELKDEKRMTQEFKDGANLENLKARYAMRYAEKLDLESDPENPVRSWDKLNTLDTILETLPQKIDEKMDEKLNLTENGYSKEIEFMDYVLSESFFVLSDEVHAFPVIEGVVDSQNIIQEEKDKLLDKAVKEHDKHLEGLETEHDPVDLPLKPVDWEELIEEENLKDYLNVHGIPTATYGDSLHLMMEDLSENIESVNSEYPLHFLNTGGENDVSKHNRLDNTLRPDAVDDLFVYEFKHMPFDQKNYLNRNGHLERNTKFIENVKQVNSYLHDLGLPTGIIVYVSSDMEVEEYVVERHDVDDWRNYEESFSEGFIHKKEDYDFQNVLKNLRD